MPISHCYWSLVVKNGNFTLLLRMAISRCTARSASRSTPPNVPWDILWAVFAAILDSSRKDGNFLLFVKIRVVNHQLALYSHVICNPSSTPQKHPHMTITNVNYEGSYLPGGICNIVLKVILADGPPTELRIDALNTTTPNLADEPTLGDGPPSQ